MSEESTAAMIDDLGIDNADEVVIYPYADVKDEDWPTYINSEGKRVPVPKGWRNVGYRYPFPTPKRTHKVRELSSGLSLSGTQEEITIRTGDPDKLAKHLTNSLIKGIVRRRPGGSEPSEQTLDQTHREWLCGELRKSAFLLSGAYVQYLREGGRAAEEEAGEEEVFTKPSGATG